MSLQLIEALDLGDYWDVAELQDNALASQFVSPSANGGTPVTDIQQIFYYDRTDVIYQVLAAATPSNSYVRHDPLTRDNGPSGVVFLGGSVIGNWSKWGLGEWNKETNTQKIYSMFNPSNAPITERSPSDLAAVAADPFPNVGPVTTHDTGTFTPTTDGYYTGPSGSSGEAGSWVFFETLGYALRCHGLVRQGGVNRLNVLAQIDLSTGGAITVDDIPTRYTASPALWEAPSFAGQSFEMSYMQFVPDEDSVPEAPIGRLILQSRNNLTDPILTNAKNIYVAVYDWNPLNLSGSNISRIHKRRLLLTRLQLLQNTSTANGGIGNPGTHSFYPGVFNPPSNSFRFYFRHGTIPVPPAADDLTMVAFSLAPDPVFLSPATQLRAVETGKTIDFSVTLTGDLGELVAGEVVTFNLFTVSSRGEAVGTGTGSLGATLGDFALANAPIDAITDVLSVLAGATSYTPRVSPGGRTGTGNEVEVDLANGDLQFFVNNVATDIPLDDDIVADYDHFQVPVSPANGTLLGNTTRTDETGQAFAQVRYVADADLENRWEQLDATTD